MRRFLFFIAVLSLLASCTGRKVYDHYEHTPLSGWDSVDDLTYDIPALTDSGRYVTTVGLRINTTYPFQALTLVVEQKVIHKGLPTDKKKHYKSQTFSDTINCNLFDENGKIKGNGISYYQFRYRVSEMDLQQGDSLHVTIRHDMRREIMPGISDVGVSLTRQ